ASVKGAATASGVSTSVFVPFPLANKAKQCLWGTVQSPRCLGEFMANVRHCNRHPRRLLQCVLQSLQACMLLPFPFLFHQRAPHHTANTVMGWNIHGIENCQDCARHWL
ncbi:hypothetical protein TcCL_ESM04266, partial [Trypanosoma cruzi]